MKSLLVILSYIGTAVLMYTILSGIAYMFTEYTWKEITSNGVFIFFYIFLIHWIPSSIVSIEVNKQLGNPIT